MVVIDFHFGGSPAETNESSYAGQGGELMHA